MSEAQTTSTAAAPAGATATVDPAAREHAAWRAGRERGLRQPHGWLSLTALLWPTSTPGPLPGVPGEWWVADGKLFTRPAPGDTATLVGEQVVHGGLTSIGVGEGRSRVLGTFLPPGRPGTADDEEQATAVEVVLRTGRYGVRLRDPQAATRTGFEGVPTFDYDPDWVLDVPVRWYDEPEPVTVGAAQPRLVHHVEVVGEVDLEHDETLLLTGSRAEPKLLFTDETEGTAPWRVVGATGQDTAPVAPGRLRLDLNRATNLPFAFTGFGTCPAPPRGNHLPFPVRAGEKAPR